MKLDEDLLMAFADGELAGPERDAVERAIAADPAAQALLKQQLALRQMLADHYRPVAQDDVPERLLAMLNAGSPKGVPSLGVARARRQHIARSWRSLGTIAASLAAGVIAGQILLPQADGPLATRDGTLIAQSGLARTLETQLASSPDVGSTTRIGLTFADKEGRFCRTFEAPDVSGLACRTADGWQVLLASGGSREQPQYRQAGSRRVNEAAQDLMAAPPLDASAERSARDGGWKISGPGD